MRTLNFTIEYDAEKLNEHIAFEVEVLKDVKTALIVIGMIILAITIYAFSMNLILGLMCTIVEIVGLACIVKEEIEEIVDGVEIRDKWTIS